MGFFFVDALVLNYALTLELIETSFYSGALAKFDEAAFANASFPPFVRNRFVQIGEHEMTHAQLLSTVLGSQATQPCNYTLCVCFVFVAQTPWCLATFLFGIAPTPMLHLLLLLA